MTDRPADCVALHALHDRRGPRVTTVAAPPRLDRRQGLLHRRRRDYLVAIPADGMAASRPWQAPRCAAACRATRGGEWLAVEELRVAA
ncbi:MAG: hypothetical protein R2851_19360 [Caldilineaceae bacterium]